jgi:hypothetical protein
MTIQDYSDLYQAAGQQYGVPPALLMAQAQAEDASGNPNAVGPDTKYGNAVGIAQLIPDTAKRLGVTDPTDPKQAIPAQARLMRENLDRYGNIPDAVSAYHGGTDKSNWGPKTQDYTKKVTGQYQQMAKNDTTQDTPLAAALKNFENDSTQPSVPATSKSSDDTPLATALKNFKDDDATQNSEAKNNPTLFEQYGSDVDTARKRITDSIIQNKGGPDPLDVAGAIGSGVSSAIGQTVSHFTPDVVKNGLTTVLPVAKDIMGQTLFGRQWDNGNVQSLANTASNALTTGYHALPPSVQQHLGDTKDIIGGVASVEGLTSAASLGSDAIGAGKNLLIKSPDKLADNVLQKTVGDSKSLAPENINPTEIVPGSKPTLAQSTGDANVAALEKQLKRTPENNADFTAQEGENENARQQHLQTASGTQQDIQTLKAQRKALTEPLYEQAKAQPLNTAPIQPVLQNFDKAIQEVGSDTDAGKTLLKIKNKIQNALPATKTASTGLLDADGNPITKELPKANPTQSPLVQVFKEERDKAADDAIGEDAYANAVKTHVQPLIKQLGTALESQSEPFAKAQNLYRNLSPAINSRAWLQDLDLKDKFGNLSLSKVNNAYENALSLRSSDGINGAKDLSDTQLQTLKNIRDDLQRRDATIKLGNSVKSTNALQQPPSLIRKTIHEVIGAGVGAGTAALTGGNPLMGAIAGGTTVRGLENIAAKKSLATANALKNYTLNPENYKNYLAAGIRP